MPPFVPDGMNALDAVERLREVKSPITLVVDEYGTISGMVTLMDVLEAIVGDIPGADMEGEMPEATRREDGSWLLDKMMSVEELKLYFDLDELPEAETIMKRRVGCSWHRWVAFHRWEILLNGGNCALRLWIWMGIGWIRYWLHRWLRRSNIFLTGGSFH